MTATVVWSPNLRLAVRNLKDMKTVSPTLISNQFAITNMEEQAIQKQFSQKSENIKNGQWL